MPKFMSRLATLFAVSARTQTTGYHYKKRVLFFYENLRIIHHYGSKTKKISHELFH